MTTILAHGALGPYDDIILIGIAVIFLLMMVLSWARSRELPEEEHKTKNDDHENFELE